MAPPGDPLRSFHPGPDDRPAAQALLAAPQRRGAGLLMGHNGEARGAAYTPHTSPGRLGLGGLEGRGLRTLWGNARVRCPHRGKGSTGEQLSPFTSAAFQTRPLSSGDEVSIKSIKNHPMLH